MGCVLGKASDSVKGRDDSVNQKELRRKASELRIARPDYSIRNESFSLKERFENVESRIGLVDKKLNGSRKVRDDYYDDMRRESSFSSSRRVPRAIEGEQVAAGWPCWLVAVAGEAIKGWIPRRADTFERLNKIGQGTYSSVYKGRDLIHNKVVALKKVRFDNMDPESVKFMAREILILRRLDHPNIIKLEGLVASKTSASLYLVFEYMEHDLTGIASLPGVKFTEPQVKCYMEQLLSGLDHCHSHGVLHRDIKGSNLLIDNEGILKIADFGLASHFDDHNNVPLTSRVVTLWYRPPELLLGATKYGVAVDLWSTGCILGELYARKPIMPGRTEVEQLHKIFKLCGSPSEEYWRRSKLPHATVYKPAQPYKRRIADTFRNIPDAAIGLMETLLSVDPLDRGSAASALNSQFFQTKPLACEPSSLPKYPPSKEIDAKLRVEEKRRQGSIGVNGGNDSKRTTESRVAPTVNFNDELSKSMKIRQGEYPNPNNRSEAPYVYSINQPISSSQGLRETSKDRVFHSGPLAQQPQWRASTRKHNNNTSQPTNQVRILPESISDRRNHVLSESFGDRRDHTQIFSNSQQTDNSSVNFKEHIKDNQLGNKEKTIHFSGPLVPSSNIEQVLREHDRRIQEVTRRLKHEKARGGGRVRPHEMYLPSN